MLEEIMLTACFATITNPKLLGRPRETRVGHSQVLVGFGRGSPRPRKRFCDADNPQAPLFPGPDAFLVVRVGTCSDKANAFLAEAREADQSYWDAKTALDHARNAMEKAEQDTEPFYEMLSPGFCHLLEEWRRIESVLRHTKQQERRRQLSSDMQECVSLLRTRRSILASTLHDLREREPLPENLESARTEALAAYQAAQKNLDAVDAALDRKYESERIVQDTFCAYLTDIGLQAIADIPEFVEMVAEKQLQVFELEEHPVLKNHVPRAKHPREDVFCDCRQDLLFPAAVILNALDDPNRIHHSTDDAYAAYLADTAQESVLIVGERHAEGRIAQAVILRRREYEAFVDSHDYFLATGVAAHFIEQGCWLNKNEHNQSPSAAGKDPASATDE